MSIPFAISNWSGWAGTPIAELESNSKLTYSSTPDVQNIPPLLRRRLNLLGRAAASEILRHSEKNDDTPVVYASRHGDIERTLAILQELADQQTVSPMNFSLAVHNAICGVISIHQALRGNISTIAAIDPLVPVLLEACGLLAEGHKKILCVICDVSTPEIYREEQELVETAYATCFVLTSGNDLLLSPEQSPGNNNNDPEENHTALRFNNFLSSNSSKFSLKHNGQSWKICKQ